MSSNLSVRLAIYAAILLLLGLFAWRQIPLTLHVLGLGG